MEPKEPTTDGTAQAERSLFFVMTHATAIGFGLLAAFLYSMRDIPDDVALEFSFGTVVLFFVGWVIGWGFWRYIGHLIATKSGRSGADKVV